MNDQAETIDSSEMQILDEFPVEYRNDEEITAPENSEKAGLAVCALVENIIIAYRSRKSGRLIGEIVFEKQSGAPIAAGIDELLSQEKPWDAPIEIKDGKDEILMTFSSSQAHNLPAPLERVNIYNRRNYELDGLRSRDVWVSLPPHSAQQLAKSLAKLFLG